MIFNRKKKQKFIDRNIVFKILFFIFYFITLYSNKKLKYIRFLLMTFYILLIYIVLSRNMYYYIYSCIRYICIIYIFLYIYILYKSVFS